MRFALFLTGLVMLAACATSPAAAPSAPAVATAQPAPASSSRTAQLLAAAGRPNAPTRAEIERAFGRPDIARQEGAGAALTYRLNTCALLLLFEADQRNTLRLAEAHASARQAEGVAPSLEQCASEASAHRPS